MRHEVHGNRTVYVCGSCGLAYADASTAEACEAFCTSHNACSLEITRQAIRKPPL